MRTEAEILAEIRKYQTITNRRLTAGFSTFTDAEHDLIDEAKVKIRELEMEFTELTGSLKASEGKLDNPSWVFETFRALSDVLIQGSSKIDMSGQFDTPIEDFRTSIRKITARSPMLFTRAARNAATAEIGERWKQKGLNLGYLPDQSVPLVMPHQHSLFLLETTPLKDEPSFVDAVGISLEEPNIIGGQGLTLLSTLNVCDKRTALCALRLSIRKCQHPTEGKVWMISSPPSLYVAYGDNFGHGKTHFSFLTMKDIEYGTVIEHLLLYFQIAVRCGAFACYKGPVVVREKLEPKGRSAERKAMSEDPLRWRGLYRVLIPDETKIVYSKTMPDEESRKKLERGCWVRTHERVYQHPRYIHMKGKSQMIQSFWRGPGTWQQGDVKYVVKSAVEGDNRSPEEIWNEQ